MGTAIILFILLNFCHFLADYTPLSTPKMLSAKRFGTPIFPILTHAWVHSSLMFFALFFAFLAIDRSISAITSIYVFFLQLFTHTLFDTLKGRFAKWIPITADNTQKWYWIVMGFDQFLHQSIIALMIYILLK